MRNISFDESTVLVEYARIANEGGIIKEAAANPVDSLIQAVQKSAPSGPAKVVSDGLINELQQNRGTQDVAGLGKYLLGRYTDSKFQTLISQHLLPLPTQMPLEQTSAVQTLMKSLTDAKPAGGTGAIPFDMLVEELKGYNLNTPADQLRSLLLQRHGKNPNLRAVIESSLGKKAGVESEPKTIKLGANPLVAPMEALTVLHARLMEQYNGDDMKIRPLLNNEIAKTVQSLRRQYGNHPEIAKFESEANKIGTRVTANVVESELEKQADEKLYDVSGETGEQLVDSAHPGGGTRTEISSKTDENLVETIVEQQQRDIEVARSVPKGTYATLVKLHNQLAKMGHKDILSPLKDAILRVASTEDIVNGTLVSLSDRLDRLGYEKSSNRVDSIIQNAVGLVREGPMPSVPQPTSADPVVSPGDIALEELAGNLSNSINQLPPTPNMTEVKRELMQMSNYVRGLKGKGYDKNSVDTKLLPQLQYQFENYPQEIRKILSPIFYDIGGLQGHTAPAPTPEPTSSEKGVPAKTAPRKRKTVEDLYTDYGFALGWAKAFNKVLIKVNPKGPLVEKIHRLHVDHGDIVSRRAKQVIGPFKTSLTGAIEYWKGAGRWKGLEKHLVEQNYPRLIAVYPNRKAEFDALIGLSGKDLPYAEPPPQGAKETLMSAPEGEGGFMKTEYVRNTIYDRIMKKLDLRDHQVDIQGLYSLALGTAKKYIKKLNLTADDEGQRRLSTMLARMLNHPKFNENIKKYIK